jgi:hypothetical protein
MNRHRFSIDYPSILSTPNRISIRTTGDIPFLAPVIWRRSGKGMAG